MQSGNDSCSEYSPVLASWWSMLTSPLCVSASSGLASTPVHMHLGCMHLGTRCMHLGCMHLGTCCRILGDITFYKWKKKQKQKKTAHVLQGLISSARLSVIFLLVDTALSVAVWFLTCCLRWSPVGPLSWTVMTPAFLYSLEKMTVLSSVGSMAINKI